MNVDTKEPSKPITTQRMTQTSFAGIDTRVRLNGQFDNQIQGISLLREKVAGEWVIKGTIIRLLVDDGAGCFPEHIDNIQIMCADEFGRVIVAWEVQDVDIISHSTGICMDDMVIEEQYNFEAKVFKPGRQISARSIGRTISVHTKRGQIAVSPETEAIVKQALEATKEEPSDFLTDLTTVLDKYGVIL